MLKFFLKNFYILPLPVYIGLYQEKGDETMAIEAIKTSTVLEVKYPNGQNKDGSPKIVGQKITVDTAATDEKLFQFGKLVSGILASEATDFKKIETSSLIQNA